MDVNFDNENATTYNCSYGYKQILPPLKLFRQIPSIELCEAPKLQPRQFPIEPTGPKRHLEAIPPHLPNIQLFHDKPIVRAPAPLDFEVEPIPNLTGKPQKFHKPAVNISQPLPALGETQLENYPVDVDREQLEELCRVFRWTSTTRAATEEACLPVIEKPPLRPTLEVNADLVMNKPTRYESTPRLWQRVAPRWDQTQERSAVPCISTRKMLTTSKSNPSKLPKKCSSKVDVNDETYRLSKENKLTSTFVRQAPGYAGFVPRTPLEVPMARAKSPDYKPSSTMRSSFRPFPSETLRRLLYYRRGPLSKTVTLTYPFNPFSKVEQRAFSRNYVERPW